MTTSTDRTGDGVLPPLDCEAAWLRAIVGAGTDVSDAMSDGGVARIHRIADRLEALATRQTIASDERVEALAREQFNWQMGATSLTWEGLNDRQRDARLSQARHWVERLAALSAVTPDLSMVREALEEAREEILCGRDYANDAAVGGLVLLDGASIKDMAKGDVERMTTKLEKLDACLAALLTPEKGDAS